MTERYRVLCQNEYIDDEEYHYGEAQAVMLKDAAAWLLREPHRMLVVLDQEYIKGKGDFPDGYGIVQWRLEETQ